MLQCNRHQTEWQMLRRRLCNERGGWNFPLLKWSANARPSQHERQGYDLHVDSTFPSKMQISWSAAQDSDHTNEAFTIRRHLAGEQFKQMSHQHQATCLLYTCAFLSHFSTDCLLSKLKNKLQLRIATSPSQYLVGDIRKPGTDKGGLARNSRTLRPESDSHTLIFSMFVKFTTARTSFERTR